jgi:hypothetical protein
MTRAAIAAQFEPVAWWYTREEIGRGLREYYGPAGDLPARLQLLVEKLDESEPTWLTNLCVLAFVGAILFASFRFHFVF